MPDDALLIKRAQRGDTQAFADLMGPHETKLYALCLRMLGSREDSMDCVQEAMLRVWRALGSYRQKASFVTWCYRIATNACLDLLRRQKARPALSLDVLTEAGFTPQEEGGSGDPQAQAEASARRQALEAGIATLPPDLRAALVLRDIQDFSYEEVADILQIPLGTVKSRISRARDKLRAALEHDTELFVAQPVYMEERRVDE